MMYHRPYSNYSTRKEREDFELAEMERGGKNRKGGTGHKMSTEKRAKARKNRKKR